MPPRRDRLLPKLIGSPTERVRENPDLHPVNPELDSPMPDPAPRTSARLPPTMDKDLGSCPPFYFYDFLTG